MRKSILIVLMAVVSNSVAAEWVEVGRNQAFTYYVDPATIRKAGDLAKVWSLFGFNRAVIWQGKSYTSERDQHEYDCKEERGRLLYVSFHSGDMAEGDLVAIHSDPGKWIPVAPNTVDEILWQIACGKFFSR